VTGRAEKDLLTNAESLPAGSAPPRPAGPGSAPSAEITVGELRMAGKRIFGRCRECGHERTIDPMREPFDGLERDMPVAAVGVRQLKCRCGSKQIITMPEQEKGSP